MSERGRSGEERLLELLADEAIFGLIAEEQKEFDTLLAETSGIDRDCMRRAAAAFHLGSISAELESMPTALKQRILARAI